MNRRLLITVAVAAVLALSLFAGYEMSSNSKQADDAKQMEQALRDWEQSRKPQVTAQPAPASPVRQTPAPP